MERIIIVGSNKSSDIASKLNAQIIEVPNIYENDFGVVNDFVIDKLNGDFDVVIIDIDRIERPDLALSIGMYMRLSVFEIKENALKPIIFTSDKLIKSFLHYKTFSQLLTTRNVYFQSRSNIITDAVQPIDPKSYTDDFLDFINIRSEQGRHSLANQWGASVIDKLVNKDKPSSIETIINAEKSLYFKFVNVQTIDVADYLSGKEALNGYVVQPVYAEGKHILLIDDEADKGWEYVLKCMIKNAEAFQVIGHKMKDYQSLSKEEKDMIKKGNFDLIFLDLRMNGIEEDGIYKPEEFSGMKILKQIKKVSPGTQVIMFTASNKAWNLKALLDAGADGYYIKESPEYKFSFNFSKANYETLRETIVKCLKRKYLRDADAIISKITKDFNQTHVNKPFKDSIINQLRMSYTLLSEEHFPYAYISLYQVIEMINYEKLEMEDDGTWYIIDTNEDVKNWTITPFRKECKDCKFTDEDKKKKFPEWKKIASLYYQLWKQSDKSFGYRIQQLIDDRNKLMHNDTNERKSPDLYNEKGYMKLLGDIALICNFI